MGPVNDPLLTTRTECRVHLMSWNISDIDIFKPLSFGNPVGIFQYLQRSGWKIRQFILRKKSIEVNGGIFSQIGLYADAHLPDIFWVVIQRRDHEVDDFEMPSIRLDGSQGMQHWLQFGGGNLTVEFFCEGFEIDGDSIHILKESKQGISADRPIGVKESLQSFLLCHFDDVKHILIKNRWLGVGEGDGFAMLL